MKVLKQVSFAMGLARNWSLIVALTRRGISEKYQGSAIGAAWCIIQPIAMLGIYSFVFTTIFKSRWQGAEDLGSKGYTMYLFAGLIVFNAVAEVITMAPGLIRGKKSYVTKVVFPLEVLSVCSVFTAAFQAGLSLIILCTFQIFLMGKINVTVLLVPLVWLPLFVGLMPVSWLISAGGVYLRDLEQVIPVAVSMLMFLSVVFYPIESIPESYRWILELNPLVQVIESTRSVVLMGNAPNLKGLFFSCFCAFVFAEVGYRLFKKAQRGFADVM